MRSKIVLLAAALAVVGCFGDDEPNAPVYSFDLEVTPTEVDLLQDDFEVLDPVITNVTLGQVVPDQRVVLSSANPDVAEAFYANHDGNAATPAVPIIFATGGGTTTITARFRNATVDIPVTVTAVPITAGSITADPGTTVFVGEEIELTTAFEDAAGNEIDRDVEFESSDEDVAEVDADGVVTIVGSGNATITATSDGFETTIVVTGQLRPVSYIVIDPESGVLEDGETLALTATTFAANDEELSGRAISWTSSNAAAASVSQAGVVTAHAVAATTTVTITATSEGVTKQAFITVLPSGT